MIKLKDLITIKESYVKDDLPSEYSDIKMEMEQEFLSGQKYQSWKLVPARDFIILWATFSKYGRIDEDKLDKVWEIVKENVIKIAINTSVWQGEDPEFFGGKEKYDDVTRDEWERYAYFISDRSNNQWIRNLGEVEGNARYSDAYQSLFKLLEKCYKSNTPEELLINIDTILNFVHGLGKMAKWFVEGGTSTLDKVRDLQVKGIHLKGKINTFNL